MAYKMTEDVIHRLEQALLRGATYELAAKYAGITYTTYRVWVLRGEAELERRENPRVQEGTKKWDDEQPFVAFVERMELAVGQASAKWLDQIEKAAQDGAWQAAAWKLERRHPEAYGRRVMDIDMTSGGEKLQAPQIFLPAVADEDEAADV